MHPSLRSATLRDCILWILRRYRRFRVTGHSMTPLLRPGSEVLIDPTAYTHTLPTPGDIVVAAHPQQPALRIIKRVEFVEPDGRCYLTGENPDASSDSRQFGLVPQAQVIGKVICRFP